MRRTAAVLTVALLAALGLAAPAGARAGASYKPCAGGFNPDGSPGPFYSKIKVKRITCAAGRKVVKNWVIQAEDSRVPPTATRKVLGYTCKGTASGEALDVKCTKANGKAVAFHGQP